MKKYYFKNILYKTNKRRNIMQIKSNDEPIQYEDEIRSKKCEI